MWNYFILVINLSRCVVKYILICLRYGVLLFFNLFFKVFLISLVFEGRTYYFFIRVRRSMLNILILGYLKDGFVKCN